MALLVKIKEVKDDPQKGLLKRPGPFGVDYVPRSKRARVVDGRVSAGKVSEFVKGKPKVIVLDRFRIALFRIGDRFYAIKDACPHAEYPLSKGILEPGEVIRCASHNWCFSLADGHAVRAGLQGPALPGRAANSKSLRRKDHHGPPPDLKVRTFPVMIEEEELWIQVGGA